MIERITIKNFKSFKDVSLKLGPMNIFIGPNASGKSNFFDALRVLQGIGYGFTLREILDGKPKSATSKIWDGIRGGSAQVGFAHEDGDKSTSFQVIGRLAVESNDRFYFAVAFSSRKGLFREESLSIQEKLVYEADAQRNDPPSLFAGVRSYGNNDTPQVMSSIEQHSSCLTQMADQGCGSSRQLARVFTNMERINPSPSLLREYSKAYEIERMGESGENFAALVRMICAAPDTKEAYLQWLREMRPREVDDIGVLKGALGEPMFMMKGGIISGRRRCFRTERCALRRWRRRSFSRICRGS